MGNLVEDSFNRVVTQRRLAFVLSRTLFPSKLDRLAEADDSRHVFRRGALSALRCPPSIRFSIFTPLRMYKNPTPFLPIQFVRASCLLD